MKWDNINEDWKSANSLLKWSFGCPCRRGCFKVMLRYGKTGNKKRVTCPTTLLKNELNSDFSRFTTQIKPVLQQIRLLTGLKVGGKTRNTTTQLVLQQYCKTSCAFFAARFSVPLACMFYFPIEVPGELDPLSFHKLCLHMHVNKTKFERNSSLEYSFYIKYYHMTNTRPKHDLYIGKLTNHTS